MNIFDILGPIMVGPSSSHTAGAVKIGWMARKLLGNEPAKALIKMHGSFAATGKGHGTDKAIVAGLLGMHPDDMRIPESFALAETSGMEYDFQEVNISGAHPNTALLEVWGKDGRYLSMQASSLGGGRVMINRLGDTQVDCNCEIPTLIIQNVDRPGLVADVTAILFQKSVNVANMSLYRNKRGGNAVMVIETDQEISKETLQWLEKREGILKITYISLENDG